MMLARSLLSLQRQALLSPSTSSSRLFCSHTNVQRSLSVISRTPLPRANYSSHRPFTPAAVGRSSGEADEVLVRTLQAEIDYETAPQQLEPDWLTTFKSEGKFEIEDKPGSEEIVLTRKFGNESIQISFSCSNFRTEMEDEDSPLEADSEAEPAPNCRIRTAISIMKSGKGGIVIHMIAYESGFEIENVSYYDDEKLALDETSENEWKRRGLYFGPGFEELDPNLQEAFLNSLCERGIDAELSMVILNLADWKEQKEYVSWLNKMINFVKA